MMLLSGDDLRAALAAEPLLLAESIRRQEGRVQRRNEEQGEEGGEVVGLHGGEADMGTEMGGRDGGLRGRGSEV
jgi:hypothetical protein